MVGEMQKWVIGKMLGSEVAEMVFTPIYLLLTYALPHFPISAYIHLCITPTPHLRITLIFINILILSKN